MTYEQYLGPEPDTECPWCRGDMYHTEDRCPRCDNLTTDYYETLEELQEEYERDHTLPAVRDHHLPAE